MIYWITLIIGFILLSILHLYFIIKNKNKFNNAEKVVLQIQVSKENEKTPLTAESIFSSIYSVNVPEGFFAWFFGKTSPRFSFEIATINQEIYFYVWCPVEYKKLIKNQLFAQYPDIEITEVQDYTDKTDLINSVSAEISTIDPYIFPIKRHPEFNDSTTLTFYDPMSAVTSAFAQLNATDEQLWAQIIITPAWTSWRHRGIWCANKISGGFRINSPAYESWYTNMLLKRGLSRLWYLPLRLLLLIFWLAPRVMSQWLNEEVEKSHKKETIDNAIMWKLSQSLFHTSIRFVYRPRKENLLQAKRTISEVISSFYQFNLPRFNSFAPKIIKTNDQVLLKRYKNRENTNTFLLNVEEIATLWHMPNTTVLTPNIQWVYSKKLEAPINLPKKEIVVKDDFTAMGETNFRGHNSLFGIKRDDRRRHIYILWKTGMGKSTILENMLFSDIKNNKGVAVIDPHGDLADAVLSFVPKRRTNDVILFDPSDTAFPVSFNMLECKTEEQRWLVASGLLWVFKKMFWDSWWPRLEHILRNTILALTEVPWSTMLGIMKMLTNDNYRKQVLKKVTNSTVLDFWNEEFGRWKDRQRVEAIAPIQNKVWQFLSFPMVRNMLGQPKSSIDLRFAMDKKKIVIINLSKGKIGEDNSAMLGSMLVTKFQLDAMSRADTSEKNREDFYLYVDEFQNFATEAFATILSEARKYKLNLTMANQYIAQMEDVVKDAVFGNVGTIVTCQVGADDAEYLVQQFSEQVTYNDIVNLPKYHSYMRLMIDGMPSKVFSVSNLPPPDFISNESQQERIRSVAREKYAKPRDFVENKINEWMANPSV